MRLGLARDEEHFVASAVAGRAMRIVKTNLGRVVIVRKVVMMVRGRHGQEGDKRVDR